MIKACLHCGLDTERTEEKFCCAGCCAAYKIINKFGFKNYYNLRQIDSKERKMKPQEDERIDIDEFITENENGSYCISLMVQGIHCAACVWLIESILKKQKNVIKARVNLSRKTLFLEWNKSKDAGNELISIISDIGYKILPFDEKIIQEEEKKYGDNILKSLAVAGFGAGNVMLFSIVLWISGPENMGDSTRNLLHFFSALLALPAIIYSSRPFFSSAFKAIKAGYPNMDLAICMAISLSCLVSLLETLRGQTDVYFDSAMMLVFFLLIGRYLDLKARKKAFSVASQFAMLCASFGRVESDDGQVKIIPIKDLEVDMVLVVAVGEKIAADGIIIDGNSEVDASLINGESLPKLVKCQDQVFSGMINLESPLKVKVTKRSKDSLLAQIVTLSEEVEGEKNHYVRMADRFSRFYTPVVHVLAFATFISWCFYFGIGWEAALVNATAVLIITCPCALALAVPIVQTIAISNFIKKGILVKSGQSLERLREVGVVVFDKTGSLTIGKPELLDIILLKDESGEKNIILTGGQRSYYLRLASSLAVKSKHPISIAISKEYQKNYESLESLSVQESRGFGMESEYQDAQIRLGRKDFCEIDREVDLSSYEHGNFISTFMKVGDQEVVFLLSDKLKQDAQNVVSCLKDLGKKVILLSGDSEKAVRDVANKVNISEFYFEQTPLSKVEFLQSLESKVKNNQSILMVGDGLNDAPSLAAADISISFSQGSDISQNIADIVIQGERLEPIISLINSSRKAIWLMKQNLIIALIYNLIAVPFAVIGFVSPLIAALAMSSSSLLVLLNSLRMNQGSHK